MNILYLSYDGMTDPLGQSQVLPYLTGLAKQHFITLISFEKEERSKNYDSIRNQIKNSGIEWIPLDYHKSPPVISTLYDVSILWKAVTNVRKNKTIHFVHCRSYITALIGLRLKKKFRIPFLFDMRGFWADERVEGGLWNLSNPLYRIVYNRFKAWEKEFIVNADEIVTLTNAGCKEVMSWKLNDSITVIPCCVDDVLFNPLSIDSESGEKLRFELGIGLNEFVLTYSGSLGTWYLLDEMMEFYAVLRKRVPPAKFLILTSESIDFSHWSWNNEIIVRQVRREEMPLYLSISNASLFFIKPTYSKKGSSATKMAELMAMNIPFVTNSGWGDVEEILSNESGGLLISSLNESSFAKAVNDLIHPLPASRPLATNYFSLTRGINLYGQVYARIEKRNS